VAGGCDFILISVTGKMSQTVIRSGLIAIVGRPNVRKSALFNRMGRKLRLIFKTLCLGVLAVKS
jgi:tRNA U34 5-carboxymethylaminomethyl modifying GTPase MnmE/TrmE